MRKMSRAIVKFRVPILILSVLLLIPAFIGMVNTRINYDILSYLPGDIDSMKGQDIMLEDFGKGGFAYVIVEGMDDKNVAGLDSLTRGDIDGKDGTGHRSDDRLACARSGSSGFLGSRCGSGCGRSGSYGSSALAEFFYLYVICGTVNGDSQIFHIIKPLLLFGSMLFR